MTHAAAAVALTWFGAASALTPLPGNTSKPWMQEAVPGGQEEASVYQAWYDLEEWASTAPSFTPEEEAELLQGTDPQLNLCIGKFAVPEVMVIGPPKTGTTSLCSALRYTPSAVFPKSVAFYWGSKTFPARWKEGHFFDDKAGNKNAFHDYGHCDQSVRRITIEGAARYANDPRVPNNIYKAYGDARQHLKFVYIFRDPLPRLLSQVNHGKDQLWCVTYLAMTFEQICKRIYEGRANDWMGSRTGCGDTVEGSMYSNHIKRYFSLFESRQFRFIPFKYITEPGEGGRPSKAAAQELWEQLGAKGLPPPEIHTNRRSKSTPESLLTPATFSSINAWFDERTGPKVLAELLVNTDAELWHFSGVRDVDSVAEWIGSQW